MAEATAVNQTPAILVWGARQARDYHPREFDHAFFTGFHDQLDATFTLDARPYGQRFLAACAAWAISAGVLALVDTGTDRNGQFCTLRLTEAGRARYGADAQEAAQ